MKISPEFMDALNLLFSQVGKDAGQMEAQDCGRILFQVDGESPHERAWVLDGKLYAPRLKRRGGDWVLVLELRA